MKDIVVDACCLINLLAAGNVFPKQSNRQRKEPWFPAVVHVPTIVASEALYIMQPDVDDPAKLAKSAIDLSVPRQLGLLHDCDLQGEEESGLFVQLAMRLDDGEAACLAIAKSRKWALASDDRVAANLADELNVEVVNTAQMVKLWSDHLSVSDQEITDTISNIQIYAKFVPRRQSAEFDWWSGHATDS